MEAPGVSMVMETGPGAAERRLMLETRDWRDTETMLLCHHLIRSSLTSGPRQGVLDSQLVLGDGLLVSGERAPHLEAELPQHAPRRLHQGLGLSPGQHRHKRRLRFNTEV